MAIDSLPPNLSNISYDCEFSPATIQFKQTTYFILYYVIFPAYFVLSTFGQTVLLLAFQRQSKKEKAYMFQVFFTIGKLLETVVYFVSILARKWWSGMEENGVVWFKRQYILMWYSARIATSSVNWFITSSLLISVAMAADRVLALTVPFLYKNLNHRRNHRTTAGVCFFLGIITSLFDCFRFYVVKSDTGMYSVKVDQAYLVSPVAMALANLRNAIRILAVISLSCLNIVMILAFRKRSIKVAQMTHRKEEEAQTNRKNDRILILLTGCQSVLTCISMVPIVTYYTLTYMIPGFAYCAGSILLIFVDGAISMADSIDCFVIFALDKKLRQMICGILKCGNGGIDSTRVVAVIEHGQISRNHS